MVAATEQAWRWIDRLGVPGPDPRRAAATAHLCPRHARGGLARNGGPPGCACGRRTAPGRSSGPRHLPPGSQVPAGYAVTLEAAPADDLAPLLMRAWRLTRREREVARLVIDGLSTESIATALFISVHTVRDHLKMIFGKTASAAARNMVTALTGRTPTPAHAAP